MNKIYLFDDDKDNQQAIYYNASHIVDKRYSDCFSYVKNLIKDDIEKTVVCENPAALLIHKTFLASDEKNNFTSNLFDEIEDFFNTKFPKCPQVHFSWGDSMLKIQDNKILAINKSIFYANLEEFILEYKNRGEIDIQTLAYGGFKMAEKLRPYLKKIKNDLVAKNGDSTFDLTYISLENLEQFHKLSISSMDLTSFENWIEESDFRVKEFLELLDKTYNSVVDYGKNIYY